MADRFEELRNPSEQEGAEVKEERVDSVSEKEMENAPEIPLSSSERELRKANRLSVVLLLMVFVMICLFIFLFFTDRLILGIENPLSKESVTVQESNVVEEEEEEVVVEEKEEYRLFKNMRETLDSEGNVVGSQELMVKFYPNDERFEMDVLNALGNGVVVEGTYVEEGERIILSFERGAFGLESDGSLEFTVSSEDGSILEYSGSDFGDTLPDQGDRYFLY